MTRSKSPSLASIQGTRPSSGRSYSWFSYPGAPQENRALQNLLMAFVWKPYYLLFVSFLPSSFKNPCLRNSRFIGPLYRKQERLYNLSLFFVNTVSFFFSTFFSSRSRRSFSAPRSFGAQRNTTYHTHLKLSICRAAFFQFFPKKIDLNEIK
jgi:hypothetical protein